MNGPHRKIQLALADYSIYTQAMNKTTTLTAMLYDLAPEVSGLQEAADRMANLRRTLEAILPYAQMCEDIKLLERAKELIE